MGAASATQVREPAAAVTDTRRNILLACFFLSGAAGLIYEVVWVRVLTLTFGATVLGVSTVLTAFMGGLALGSFLFGRWIDRHPEANPLRLYGLLELGIGLYCALTPLIFWLLQKTYVGFAHAASPEFTTLTVVRFVLCFLALLPPTTLMGATLPVLSRFFVREWGSLGQGVGALYSVNTFGAVLGSFGAGFFLVPMLGVRGSIWLAAGLNVAIGLVCRAVGSMGVWECGGTGDGETRAVAEARAAGAGHQMKSRKERRNAGARAVDSLSPTLPHSHTPTLPHPLSRATMALVLTAYGLSGFAALVYEVAWTRALALVFGTSVYAFATMLTAFLCGLATGAALCARVVDRWRHLLAAFGLCQLAIAAACLATTPLFSALPYYFLWMFKFYHTSFWALQFAQFAVCFAIMLPATLLMGATFPIVSRLYAGALRQVGRGIGNAYAANTVGTILGSFLAGFVLMPMLGAEVTIRLAVAINLALGLALLVAAVARNARGEVLTGEPPLGLRPSAAYGATLGVFALLAVAWVALPRWNQKIMSSGVYINAKHYLQAEEARGGTPFDRQMDIKEIRYYADGLFSTVSVAAIKVPFAPATEYLSLQINGKTDASSGDLTTQLLVAHVPMLAHRDPKDVLVIGLASGSTLGSVEQYPIRKVDCVEIEPKMQDACRYFDSVNHRALDDRRLELILDDGRNHVLLTNRKYDVITSEPSNPWITGVSNLFTREYYTACRARLKPGGVFCHWIPVYNMAPADFRTAVNTFVQAFPHTTLWSFPPLMQDVIAIGSLDPQRIDPREMARRIAQPAVAADLKLIDYHDAWDLLQGFLMDEQAVGEYVAGGGVNVDDRPIIEFATPRTIHTDDPSRTMLDLVQFRGAIDMPLAPRAFAASDAPLSLAVPDGATAGIEVRRRMLERGLEHRTVGWARWPVPGGETAASGWRVPDPTSVSLAEVAGSEVGAQGRRETGQARMGGHPAQWVAVRRDAGPMPFTSPETCFAAAWFCPRNRLIYQVTRTAPHGQEPTPAQVLRELASVRCRHE